MIKLKAGDRVRIRDWDDMEREFGLNAYGAIQCENLFTPKMRRLCGQEGRVTAIRTGVVETDIPDVYPYTLSADMLERIRPPHKKDGNIIYLPHSL